MSKKRKFLLVEMYERNGEYEYSNTHLVSISSRMNQDKKLLQHAKSHYPDAVDVEFDENHQGYYFNCGEVFVKPGKALEITEEMFEVLKQSPWIPAYTY